MSNVAYVGRANLLARWSLVQAIWPPALLAIMAAMAAILGPELLTIAVVIALAAAVAAAVATFAYSTMLMFDALLFRLMASYEDEWKGGAAVDDILARMRLKPSPASTRSLDDRAAGTRRLVLRQRVALTIACAALLYLTSAPA